MNHNGNTETHLSFDGRMGAHAVATNAEGSAHAAAAPAKRSSWVILDEEFLQHQRLQLPPGQASAYIYEN